MNSLVELISRIGIFMLAGQAVIHFAPEQKYAKYMKLIVGLMILIQFLSPVYKLMGGMEIDWGEQLSNIEVELEEGVLNDGGTQANSLNESIISGMEKEIKSKLNSEIMGEGYSVIKVAVDINNSNSEDILYNGYNNSTNSSYNIDNSSYEKYEFNSIWVAVRLHDEYKNSESTNENINGSIYESENATDNNVVKVDKVSIQKITMDEEAEQSDKTTKISGQGDSYDKQDISDRLRERFCNVLGIEEKYMEVSIYGTVE